VTADENRRIEVFERELWRIAVEHLDYGEQVQWSALAGARVAPTGWRRARAMLHFDQGGELKRTFLTTAVERNKNPQLRLKALQEIAAGRDAEAFDRALDFVESWPRDDKREGVKVVLQALAEKKIGRRDQANNWIWRCANMTREVHEEYAVQRWPETKRLLGLLVNSSGGAHARNARRLVHAARQQDRRLAAALLAAALPHTAEAGEVVNGARTRMSRKPAALARELLRNFPKGKGKSKRRRKKKPAGEGAPALAGARGTTTVDVDLDLDAATFDEDGDGEAVPRQRQRQQQRRSRRRRVSADQDAPAERPEVEEAAPPKPARRRRTTAAAADASPEGEAPAKPARARRTKAAGEESDAPEPGRARARRANADDAAEEPPKPARARRAKAAAEPATEAEQAPKPAPRARRTPKAAAAASGGDVPAETPAATRARRAKPSADDVPAETPAAARARRAKPADAPPKPARARRAKPAPAAASNGAPNALEEASERVRAAVREAAERPAGDEVA